MSIYDDLAAPFAQTFTDTRGGATFDYLTGEQVATRLNEVLGPGGWSFKVLHQELHAEADEWWVLGQLTATFPWDITREQTVVREQYGSQKVRRSRATSTPLDTGFDLKAAATDAMKKCASLIGVGLYLSHKEGQAAQPKRQPSPARPLPPTTLPNPSEGIKTGKPGGPVPDIYCVECGQLVEPHAKKGGGTVTAKEIADLGQKTFDRVLCGDCFKIALAARNAVSGAKRAG